MTRAPISKTWDGGKGNFLNVQNWQFTDGSSGTPPQFAPGDTAVISSGEADLLLASLTGIGIQIAGQGTLDVAFSRLNDVSINVSSTLKLEGVVLDKASTTGLTSPSVGGAPAVLEIQGFAISAGFVGVGLRGFATLVLPGTTQIDPNSVFVNSGSIFSNISNAGASISGSNSSILVNDGTISGIGSVTAAVVGHGTFSVPNVPGRNTPSFGGSLRFGGLVGSGEQVEMFPGRPAVRQFPLTLATLELDKPMQFLGEVKGYAPFEQIELPNIDVTSEMYKPTSQTTGELVLMHSHDIVADIRLATGASMTENYRTDEFVVTKSGGTSFVTVNLPPTATMATLPLS